MTRKHAVTGFASFLLLLALVIVAFHGKQGLVGKEFSEERNLHATTSSSTTERNIICIDLHSNFYDEDYYTTLIATQACAGLYNRAESKLPFVYTILNDKRDPNNDKDEFWRDEVIMPKEGDSDDAIEYMEVGDFIGQCLHNFPRRIRYNYQEKHSFNDARAVVPNVLTLGAVLDAIPLEDSDAIFDDKIDISTIETSFDATTHPSFIGHDSVKATLYVYEKYGPQTSAMAKLNPGFDRTLPTWHNEERPRMVRNWDAGMIDLVFRETLFTFYLYYGCAPDTDIPGIPNRAHELETKMANERAGGRWASPVPVYGYDDTWNIMGGTVFEAETTCVKNHNMGQIASAGVNNLSFFKSWGEQVTPNEINLHPDREEEEDGVSSVGENEEVNGPRAPRRDRNVVYDKTKTYIAVIIGDGDNLKFMKGVRTNWMLARSDKCQDTKKYPNGCYPLTWTISPHLATLAPDVLRWYLSKVKANDYHDTFILPPSGHLYAYPAMMPGDVQDQFVNFTEDDARLFDTTGVVDWEWFTAWKDAEEEFYPRYAKKGLIRGIFTVNVPFMVPTMRFRPNQFFKIIKPKGEGGADAVMFRPREWRGVTSPSKNDAQKVPFPKKDYNTPQQMADEFGAYKRGTIGYVYTTSDFGLDIGHISSMADLLPDHVELVSTETATAFALEAAKMMEQEDEEDREEVSLYT